MEVTDSEFTINLNYDMIHGLCIIFIVVKMNL